MKHYAGLDVSQQSTAIFAVVQKVLGAAFGPAQTAVAAGATPVQVPPAVPAKALGPNTLTLRKK